MKLTIERDALTKALGHATSVVERRNTIPVLANVMLEAVGDELRLAATNLDLQIRLAIPARVEVEGATTVAAHLFAEIARELAGGSQVEVDALDGRLALVSGRSRYSLPTLPRDDFPLMHGEDEAVSFDVPAKALTAMMSRVAVAQASDSLVLPHLCGIHFRAIAGMLVIAATDRNFVAEASCTLPPDAEKLQPSTLPSKFAAELSKLIGDVGDGNVLLRFSPRRASAAIGKAELTGKLLEGTFLEWQRVFPASSARRLTVARDSLVGAVRRAMLVCNDKTRIVKIALSADKITATGSSPEFGSSAEEAPAAYDAEELTVGFNSKYLLDALGAAKAEQVQVDFGDEDGRAVLTNPNDDSARWLVGASRV
jgi:DNA polymerase-3 subunit beta